MQDKFTGIVVSVTAMESPSIGGAERLTGDNSVHL